MGLEGGDELVGEDLGAAGDAEGAVAHVAAGAAGDLAELGGGEAAELEAVELPVGGEGDVVDVEIEAMPMAPVATRKSTSPDWKSSTWALRVRGLSDPGRRRRRRCGSARRW